MTHVFVHCTLRKLYINWGHYYSREKVSPFLISPQIAYWVHVYPELYFQRVKKEDMPARVQANAYNDQFATLAASTTL